MKKNNDEQTRIIQLGDHKYKIPINNQAFLPAESYKLTADDIKEGCMTKIRYTHKVLDVIDNTFKDIATQRKKGKVQMLDVYKSKVIDVVADYVYWHKKELSISDFTGKVFPENSLATSESLK